MRQNLFDVVISNAGDSEDPSAAFITITIVDTHHKDADGRNPVVAVSDDFGTLNEALEWARNEVTKFLHETSV